MDGNPEFEARRAALDGLREFSREVMGERLLGAIRKPAKAPEAPSVEQGGESLMDRIRRLKGEG